MKEIKALAGEDINSAAQRLLDAVGSGDESPFFVFNEVRIEHEDGDTVESIVKRYHAGLKANHEAYLASPEYAGAQERRRKEAEERPIRFRESVEALRGMTEEQLREAETPWPHSIEELEMLVTALAERSHDYGTCCYAASISAEAAFNFIAHRLGITGFQASCADLDFIRRTRHLEHGFALVDFGNALYPQYMDEDHWWGSRRVLVERREELAKAAREMLADRDEHVHPNVREHWEWLAARSEEGS